MGGKKQGMGSQIKKHILTAIGYMIPLVAVSYTHLTDGEAGSGRISGAGQDRTVHRNRPGRKSVFRDHPAGGRIRQKQKEAAGYAERIAVNCRTDYR